MKKHSRKDVCSGSIWGLAGIGPNSVLVGLPLSSGQEEAWGTLNDCGGLLFGAEWVESLSCCNYKVICCVAGLGQSRAHPSASSSGQEGLGLRAVRSMGYGWALGMPGMTPYTFEQTLDRVS